jgi:hypothetical protein
MSEKLICWNCGAALEGVPLPLSRHEHCPRCAEALHCCRLCRFYDPGIGQQCAEDRAEPPANKEGANFCEWFMPNPAVSSGAAKDRQATARAKLDALFGDD